MRRLFFRALPYLLFNPCLNIIDIKIKEERAMASLKIRLTKKDGDERSPIQNVSARNNLTRRRCVFRNLTNQKNSS